MECVSRGVKDTQRKWVFLYRVDTEVSLAILATSVNLLLCQNKVYLSECRRGRRKWQQRRKKKKITVGSHLKTTLGKAVSERNIPRSSSVRWIQETLLSPMLRFKLADLLCLCTFQLAWVKWFLFTRLLVKWIIHQVPEVMFLLLFFHSFPPSSSFSFLNEHWDDTPEF